MVSETVLQSATLCQHSGLTNGALQRQYMTNVGGSRFEQDGGNRWTAKRM